MALFRTYEQRNMSKEHMSEHMSKEMFKKHKMLLVFSVYPYRLLDKKIDVLLFRLSIRK